MICKRERKDDGEPIQATQWRLIFALSRYGGLRCPSEHLALRWGHIDIIATKHYTQVLDTHFDLATEKCSQKCNHFAASTDEQGSAKKTENTKKPAQLGTELRGEVAKWAMRDSNPRRPRCKRGALAN